MGPDLGLDRTYSLSQVINLSSININRFYCIVFFTVLNYFEKKIKCQPKIVARSLCRFFHETRPFFEVFEKCQNRQSLHSAFFSPTLEPNGSLILKIGSSTQTQRVLQKSNTHPHRRPQAQPSSFKPHTCLPTS